MYQEQGTLAENADTVAQQREQILALDAELAPEVDALLQPDSMDLSETADDIDVTGNLGEDIAPEDLGLDLDLDEATLDTASDPESDATQLSTESDERNSAQDLPLQEEVDTKLDLARAYFDMGDFDGAREILQEVIEEGADKQQEQAREMLAKLA